VSDDKVRPVADSRVASGSSRRDSAQHNRGR
jgi:hypothetical protein